MTAIHYDAPTTLFMLRDTTAPGSRNMDSRDFDTTAEAVKYAVEELPSDLGDFYLSGAVERLSRDQVLAAYQSSDFPLLRKP